MGSKLISMEWATCKSGKGNISIKLYIDILKSHNRPHILQQQNTKSITKRWIQSRRVDILTQRQELYGWHSVVPSQFSSWHLKLWLFPSVYLQQVCKCNFFLFIFVKPLSQITENIQVQRGSDVTWPWLPSEDSDYLLCVFMWRAAWMKISHRVFIKSSTCSTLYVLPETAG